MLSNHLIIYTDGASRGNPGHAAGGFIVFDSKKKKIYQESKFLEITTNNVAEHTAVLMAHEWLQRNLAEKPAKVEFFVDSQLVVNQLNGNFKIKSSHLKSIVSKTKQLVALASYQAVYNYIPRERNTLADALVNSELDKVAAVT